MTTIPKTTTAGTTTAEATTTAAMIEPSTINNEEIVTVRIIPTVDEELANQDVQDHDDRFDFDEELLAADHFANDFVNDFPDYEEEVEEIEEDDDFSNFSPKV